MKPVSSRGLLQAGDSDDDISHLCGKSYFEDFIIEVNITDYVIVL